MDTSLAWYPPDVDHSSVMKRQKTRASPQPRVNSATAVVLEDNNVHKVVSNSSLPMSSPSTTSPKQAVPVKGRRRFLADLDETASACKEGLEMQGFRIKDVRLGDEEGSIQLDVVRIIHDEHIVSLNLTVDDSSEYPGNHTFFCFAQDEEVHPHILSIIESVPNQGSRTIQDILRRVLAAIAKKSAAKGKHIHVMDEENQDREDYEEPDDEDVEMFDDEYDDDDDDLGFVVTSDQSDIDTSYLTRDFLEIVAADYRPGLVRLGADELVISVSIPSFTLADSISPRALMAWDSRLLSTSRHLTLLITGIRGVYPVLQDNGKVKTSFVTRGNKLQFKVGLSKRYKSNKEELLELVRSFNLKDKSANQDDTVVLDSDEEEEEEDEDEYDSFDFHAAYRAAPQEQVEVEEDINEEDREFIHFSLSSSLEPLLNNRFMDVLHYRLKFDLGWAGAEVLASEVHRSQMDVHVVFSEHLEMIKNADLEEDKLLESYRLPPDPLQAPDKAEGHLNLPLLVFCYLLRRLTLCSRFCLVCHDRIQTDFDALKPYVCSKKLCTYQYYNLNHGPSLEYEICARPQTVDLLVSLTYVAAIEGALEDFPDGMNIGATLPGAYQHASSTFDRLPVQEKRQVVSDLLGKLPAVADMKKYLEKIRRGGVNGSLRDFDPSIPIDAWLVLRWCIASCTAHLEELTAPEDRIGNIGSEWRQFRFTVGAPDAEEKFAAEQARARETDANAREYPSLYAFHGSPTKNWHSIIRHGLWYKTVANGRSYGNGVYFAKDGSVSMDTYAAVSSTMWPKSALHITSCVALAEIINLPQQFQSSNPFFVVQHTHWIVCRYLLVKSYQLPDECSPEQTSCKEVPQVKLDPRHLLTISASRIAIPEPTYVLHSLLQQRQNEYRQEDYDAEDHAILSAEDVVIDLQGSRPVEDDWQHDPKWRELRTMLKEQEKARCLKELGWYMPPDFITDNLFQWVVELHSFDNSLPVAQDLSARKVNSLVFEIRFPPNYPHSPPFFRILKPRFLPFSQGGGGHVTGGGSMCMDLLTADGWLPSYSISAVLLQIKLAISNLDPRPARLASDWDRPYSMQEALEGYTRAANMHGWRVPSTLHRLTAML